jgi:HSP20 family molecular chaperone IbpA
MFDDDIANRMFKEMNDLLKQLGFSMKGPRSASGRNVEIMDQDKEYIIIVELPGVEDYEVSINIDEETRKLQITTINEKYPYNVVLSLPNYIPYEYERHFANGILELTFEKF